MAFKFEKLRVWNLALELSADISKMAESFPTNEKYVLVPQIRRAADLVALNIAEGSTGQSNKEFSRFLGIALRSAIEVVSCLHIGRKREVVSESEFKFFYGRLEELIKMIQALRNTIKN
jgi:four helix bundle protein